MEKVLIEWVTDGGVQSPGVLSINSTSLTSSSQVFSKIADKVHMKTKSHCSISRSCILNHNSKKCFFEVASYSSILHLMNIKGLNIAPVKSHLQERITTMATT